MTPWEEYEPLSGSYVSEMTKFRFLNIQFTHFQVRLIKMYEKCVSSSMGKDGMQLKMSIPF